MFQTQPMTMGCVIPVRKLFWYWYEGLFRLSDVPMHSPKLNPPISVSTGKGVELWLNTIVLLMQRVPVPSGCCLFVTAVHRLCGQIKQAVYK